MDSVRELQFEIWREACRHIEIQESLQQWMLLLKQALPVESLLLRRMDSIKSTISTIASAHSGGTDASPEIDRPLTDERWKRLAAWGATGTVLHATPLRRPSDLTLIVPKGLRDEVLVGPLMNQDGIAGAIILVADVGRAFTQEHITLLESLLEPFAVALENDRRVVELRKLRDAAETAKRHLLSQLAARPKHGDEIVVGANTGLRTVMERVKLVAPSDAPVLILGDTGTGKEVIARAIHVRSRREDGPFVRVNCGAIPTELIDSQLFGHEKGSFTGAEGTRQGWFERADGGTLFLDEIGELPLIAQVRLLRVLQDGYIERVGGQEPIRVDVRVVAATHRDLASMVHSKTFREDLWYRINVFPLLLPKLCERSEDIPLLARHFANRAAERFGLPAVELSDDDLVLLKSYNWPGNIRELGAVIDRAVILGGGVRIDVATALGINRAPSHPTSSGQTRRSANDQVMLLPADSMTSNVSQDISPLNECIRTHIERALVQTRGRIEGKFGAAARLAINPHTLRAKMRKLDIDWQSFREME